MSRFSSTAATLMPPVWPDGTRSVRYTRASVSLIEATCCTGPIRATIAVDSSGSTPLPMPIPDPASMRSMFVPSRSSCASRSDFDDSERPSTPTIAAIPMTIPRADRTERRRRVLNPISEARIMSAGARRDGSSVVFTPRLHALTFVCPPRPVHRATRPGVGSELLSPGRV